MFSFFSLQQLLKMREELKQREAEVEKSLEDKQQLNNEVQNLKEGLQNLQNTQAMQVGYERMIIGLLVWQKAHAVLSWVPWEWRGEEFTMFT